MVRVVARIDEKNALIAQRFHFYTEVFICFAKVLELAADLAITHQAAIDVFAPETIKHGNTALLPAPRSRLDKCRIKARQILSESEPLFF